MSEKQLFEVFSPKSGEVMAVPTLLKMAINQLKMIAALVLALRCQGYLLLWASQWNMVAALVLILGYRGCLLPWSSQQNTIAALGPTLEFL